MPRRPRPPLTAREIAAFLSGTRAAKAMKYTELTDPEIVSLALDMASEDSPMLQHFDIYDYAYWFSRGYHQSLALGKPCP